MAVRRRLPGKHTFSLYHPSATQGNPYVSDELAKMFWDGAERNRRGLCHAGFSGNFIYFLMGTLPVPAPFYFHASFCASFSRSLTPRPGWHPLQPQPQDPQELQPPAFLFFQTLLAAKKAIKHTARAVAIVPKLITPSPSLSYSPKKCFLPGEPTGK